jgi:antitoxin component HigA of HigAB toxin-antitoxin module
MINLKLIETEEDHQLAINRITELMDKTVLSDEESSELESLASAAEKYEEKIFPW